MAAMSGAPAERSDEATTARQRQGAWRLMAAAIGDRDAVRHKLRRLAQTAKIWADSAEIARRLDNLAARGLLDANAQRPRRLQLYFGGLDQLRWVIVPGARDYYAQRGISFWFHQVLRFFDDPVSVADPSGLFSLRETITGHVLQVTHLDPIYDLELLQMWPTGLLDFEAEIVAMIDGSHPRAGTIGAIIEDAGYHGRLLDYVRNYRDDPQTQRLRRAVQSAAADRHFVAAAERFATLPGYLSWCQQLPRSPGRLVWRWLRVRCFPLDER